MRGVTIIEALGVIAIILVLIGVMWPVKRNPGRGSKRINCVNNQKQIGLGFLMWSNDHDDRFPWQVSTNAVATNSPGTLELVPMMSPTVHFRAIIKEMPEVKRLHCLSDNERFIAADWTQLASSNISYFINLEANETNSTAILI